MVQKNSTTCCSGLNRGPSGRFRLPARCCYGNMRKVCRIEWPRLSALSMRSVEILNRAKVRNNLKKDNKREIDSFIICNFAAMELSDVILHVEGELNGMPISPTNYDIKDLRNLLDDIEAMLNPDKKKTRPTISYRVEEGCIKHIFSTSKQKVIALSAVLGVVASQGNLSGLEMTTSKAIENIQNISKERNFIVDIYTSIGENPVLSITPQTDYKIDAGVWADGEFYFYGILTDAGGKKEPNIHLDVEGQTIVISTNKEALSKLEKNPLYKSYGVRVRGRQKTDTGEIDRKSLSLIELINYSPNYNDAYLKSLISKAPPSWEGIEDVDNWIQELRS